MDKIALSVTLEFDPKFKQAILSALLAHRERCLKEEPRTLQFEVLIPVDEQGKLLIFELYKDNESLAAHSSGASIARFRQEVQGKITSSRSSKCLLALPS
jgi:(4S)-4-hydroxy-5-phosphonooxypentane-2,3-dione isomerase